MYHASKLPHLLWARRLGECLMYDAMRENFYWPPMANDVYATMHDCQSCTSNRRTNRRQCKMRLFPPNGLLEFFVVDIYGLLLNTKSENQYVVVLTDWYSKLKKAIPTTRTTGTTAATILLNDWIPSCVILTRLLSENGTIFASIVFKTICVELMIATLATTECELQSNRHVERKNGPIFSRLRHYVSKH